MLTKFFAYNRFFWNIKIPLNIINLLSIVLQKLINFLISTKYIRIINSYYSNNLKTNKDIKKNFKCYKEILSLAICKTASQLLKSKQKIDKILSLKGIISNNLNNISNSKTTPKELWDIIKGDKSITVYVLNTMAKLNIIDITNDHKGVTIFDHKLAEFAELTFNEEEFKQKISGAIE